jgi:hypothetical protein
MSKAEEFIQDYTRNCSNEFEPQKAPPSVYNPWLTPDQARRAVEIAREEMIEKMQDWIADTFQYDGSNDFNGGSNDAMSMLLDDFTEYIKQAMK